MSLFTKILGAVLSITFIFSSSGAVAAKISVGQNEPSKTLVAAGNLNQQAEPTVFAKTPISRVKLLVRKLYYNYTQAYLQGTEQGLAFTRKNNYPRLFDTNSPSWIAAETLLVDLGYYDSVVPRLNTLIADPQWRVSATNCSSRPTKPLRGETFLVTVKVTWGYTSTSERYSDSADVHVTILKNKAYFYFPLCDLS